MNFLFLVLELNPLFRICMDDFYDWSAVPSNERKGHFSIQTYQIYITLRSYERIDLFHRTFSLF